MQESFADVDLTITVQFDVHSFFVLRDFCMAINRVIVGESRLTLSLSLSLSLLLSLSRSLASLFFSSLDVSSVRAYIRQRLKCTRACYCFAHFYSFTLRLDLYEKRNRKKE